MAVFQGTVSTTYINIKDSDDAAIDISAWTFRAQLRQAPSSAAALAELTNANGGFVIVDGAAGRLAMVLDDSVTDLLPVGRIHFDALRENAPAGPEWMFGGSFAVKQPVTR